MRQGVHFRRGFAHNCVHRIAVRGAARSARSAYSVCGHRIISTTHLMAIGVANAVHLEVNGKAGDQLNIPPTVFLISPFWKSLTFASNPVLAKEKIKKIIGYMNITDNDITDKRVQVAFMLYAYVLVFLIVNTSFMLEKNNCKICLSLSFTNTHTHTL